MTSCNIINHYENFRKQYNKNINKLRWSPKNVQIIHKMTKKKEET